jgi:hypothetical protein
MNLKRLAPWGVITLLGYYLVPLLIRDTGSAMVVLLAAFPAMVLLCGLLEGAGRPFSPLYAAFAALAFIPAVFLYYNTSAWIYVPLYGLLALAGSVLGRLMPITPKDR